MHALGGHYTTALRHNKDWVHCDDDRVRDMDEAEVLEHSAYRQAYILSYQRR